jgi:hypothetical protein
MFKYLNNTFFRVLFTTIIISALLSGCVYTKVSVPLDTDTSKTQLGSKIGKSYAYSIAWLFFWGDAGTAAAAKDGDIKIINHLDKEYFVILFGLYSRQTTIAYGD